MQTELLLSDTRGVYIPRDFAEIFGDKFGYEGRYNGWVYDDALSTILEGPEAELYWDAWDAILSGAKHEDYPEMNLYQDGDLFLITDEDMEFWFGE